MQTLYNFFSPNHYGSFTIKDIPLSVESFLEQAFKMAMITLIIQSLFFTVDVAIIFFAKEYILIVGALQILFALLLVAFQLMLGFTLLQLCFNYSHLTKLLLTKGVVLLINIPVAAMYLYILYLIIL